ncbi:MAG: hypothetical protein U0790_10050 [Isosphaeraceae bacterium]
MSVQTPDQAPTRDPLGATRTPPVGRGTALCMAVFFAALVAIPPIHQILSELRGSGRWRFLSLLDSFPTHESLKQFEETLARESILGTHARRFYKENMMRWLAQGSEKIVVGRDGFLFYLDEIEMSAGPGFLERRPRTPRGDDRGPARAPGDPVSAIADFHRQLADRGIHLLFVPLPVKPFVYPERVWSEYPAKAGPAWNRDRGAFLERLAGEGVDVLDVTNSLWDAKDRSNGDLFLKLDTHWAPRGVEIAANAIAEHIRPRLGGAGQVALTTRMERVTSHGDMLRVLEIEPSRGVFSPQSVEIVQVLAGEKLASGDDASPVLLLGDSFTNIYRRREMDWGEGAGLGEQLMLRLGMGVQVIAINGGGATAVRESLARKPAALDRKRVVVWACTARDLFDESIAWERVPLPARTDQRSASPARPGVAPGAAEVAQRRTRDRRSIQRKGGSHAAS